MELPGCPFFKETNEIIGITAMTYTNDFEYFLCLCKHTCTFVVCIFVILYFAKLKEII